MQVGGKQYHKQSVFTVWGLRRDTARLSRGLLESPIAIGTMATIYPQDHPTSPGEAYSDIAWS